MKYSNIITLEQFEEFMKDVLFADLQKFMVKKILTDFHNSGDNFDDYDIAEVSRKVDDGEDVPLEDFIKSWAVAYDFDDCFDVNKNENTEDVIEFFIENNTFDYLEMLKNAEYRKFMDGIMYAIS